MKTIGITEPPSQLFLDRTLSKYGLTREYLASGVPQEDYLLISNRYPIFVVADGVTLIQNLIEKRPYPNPSPAGDVTRIFCEAMVAELEFRYQSVTESDLREAFRAANAAVGAYNNTHGRTRASVDYWNCDYVAATAAFAVIKEASVYWGSICDSYVMCFAEDSTLQFKSPNCHDLTEVKPAAFEADEKDPKARAQYVWRTKRNALNASGARVGYGVVTGEHEANRYLSTGSFSAHPGDVITVCTDGFEDHLKRPEFTRLLGSWPDDLEQQVREQAARLQEQDPETFGHERTLIAVKIEPSDTIAA